MRWRGTRTSLTVSIAGMAVLAAGLTCAARSVEGPASSPDAGITAADALEPAPAPAPEPAHEPAAQPEPRPWRPPPDYLQFQAACAPGARATVAAVGDLMMHRELQRQAAASSARFRVLWADIEDLLGAADVTYANLEVPLAPGIDRQGREVGASDQIFDDHVYTGYAKFNAHPSLARDLVEAGVDVVSVANNHALDRGSLGVDRTIQSLRRAGLAYTGTRRSDEPEAPWYATTRAGDLNIAWIACTKHTNQQPDELHQVLQCDADRREITRLVQRLSRRDAIDAVIVTPHWGKEYSHEPTERQVAWAQEWLDAGAVAVIGSHPHVVQPWAKHVTPDGRETFVLYSLGNFVSHQPELPRRSTLLLLLGLTRTEDGQVRVNGVRYVPLHVRQEGEEFFVEAIDRHGGPADSRALIAELLGASNLLPADGPIETAPHCDPTWRPAELPDWAG